MFLAGFFAHKFEQEVIDTSEEISCDFIEKLSHGRLRIPTLNTAFFLYSAQHVYVRKSRLRKKGCTSYFRKLISNVDAPFATNVNACKTLSNIVFKGRVVAASTRENTLGCLRRKEKLVCVEFSSVFLFSEDFFCFVKDLGSSCGHMGLCGPMV